MPVISIEPRHYADLSSTALQGKARAARAANAAYSTMSRCYNMAGSDDSGEKFAVGYDEAARAAMERAFDFADEIHYLASQFMACGTLHATAELRARGDASSPTGFSQPSAVVDVCRATLPTSSGGDPVQVPGLDIIIDYLGSLFWPNADTGKLDTASAAWSQLGSDFESLATEVSSWRVDLTGVTSEEKTALLTDIEDLAKNLRDFATSVAGPQDSLSSVCAEYAQQVNFTREQSLIMLRDLVLEIAVGAAVSAALSLVTFGASAAAGAVALAARIAVVGGKVGMLISKLLTTTINLLLKLNTVLMRIKAFAAWANFARKQTVLARIAYSSVDSAAGAVVSSYANPWYQGDRGVTVLAAGVSGGFGGLFSAAKFMDNFGGAVVSGGLEGVIESAVEIGLTTGAFTVDDLVKAGILGMAGGGVAHGMASVLPSGAPVAGGDGSPGGDGTSSPSGDASSFGGEAPVVSLGDVPSGVAGDGSSSGAGGGADVPVSGGDGSSAGAPGGGGDAPVVGGDASVADTPPAGGAADAPGAGNNGPATQPDAPTADAPSADAPPADTKTDAVSVDGDSTPVGAPAADGDITFGDQSVSDTISQIDIPDASNLPVDAPAGDTPPVDGDTPPVDAPPADAEATAPPADAETRPADTDTTHVDTTPADGDGSKVDGDNTPTDSGVTPPSDGDTPPVETTTPADGDATPPALPPADAPPADADTTPSPATGKPILRDGSHINPDGSLKPDVRYQAGEHEYIYTTDENGHISHVQAENLHMKDHEGRLRHDPDTPGKVPGQDHAGHLIGDRFGGSERLDNLVSQLKSVNLSEYKILENQWAKALDPNQPGGPKTVTVDISISTDPATGRPVSFDVRYSIDGKPLRALISNS